jgi:hypothetical protein
MVIISRLLKVVIRSLGFGILSLVHETIVQENYIIFKVNVDVDVDVNVNVDVDVEGYIQ